MYFDTAYIAKFYCNEPHSIQVRELVRKAALIRSSFWAVAELHSVVHRRVREGVMSRDEGRNVAQRFYDHVEEGLWDLISVNDALLRRTSALILSAPRDLFLRTADAVHLTTAQESGESEVWTNDRHVLAAAPYFGLQGRSV